MLLYCSLKERGYYLVFEDILDAPIDNDHGNRPYEDWWVHPELVNMNYVKKLQEKNKHEYTASEYTANKDISCFKSYNIKY